MAPLLTIVPPIPTSRQMLVSAARERFEQEDGNWQECDPGDPFEAVLWDRRQAALHTMEALLVEAQREAMAR